MEKTENIRSIQPITPVEQIDRVHCGPACLRQTFEAFGEIHRQDYLGKRVMTDKDGTELNEIKQYLWYRGYSTEEFAGLSWSELKYLRETQDEPLWICLMVGDGKDIGSHYALIKDLDEENITLYETKDGTFSTMDKPEFMKRWRDSDDLKNESTDIHWAMLVRKRFE